MGGELRQVLLSVLRRAGFSAVTVINDVSGRSGSSLASKPGFRKLIASVCTDAVGAVGVIDVARLAIEGDPWWRFIDLCALSGTVIVDLKTSYDPRRMRDRRLLELGAWRAASKGAPRTSSIPWTTPPASSVLKVDQPGSNRRIPR
jgi:hypothetical protein